MSGTRTLNSPAAGAEGREPDFVLPQRPPESASNDPRDQAAGVAPEATADLLAAMTAARGEPGADGPQPGGDGATGASGPPAGDGASGATGASGASGPGDDAGASGLTDQQVEEALKADTTPAWLKAEITRERNRRRTAETQHETDRKAWETREAELRAQVEQLAKPPVVEDPRPSRDAFETPDAYDAAIDAWTIRRTEQAATAERQRIEAERTQQEQQQRQQQQKEAGERELTALRDSYNQKRAKAIEAHADFAEVVEADSTPINEITAITAMRAPNGPEMLYHLAKNQDELTRINALAPAEQIFELGKLSATLANRPASDVSRIPAPINPVNSGRDSASAAQREESMEETAARVRRREAASRTPMWGGGGRA